jgi:cytochrome c biogenesis factor
MQAGGCADVRLVIHPDLLWLAVAFVTVMAGMLAAAPE